MSKGYSFPRMCAVGNETANILQALVSCGEFRKSDWDNLRAKFGGITLKTAEKHELICFVRYEKFEFQKEVDVWTDPVTHQKYLDPWDISTNDLHSNFGVEWRGCLWSHESYHREMRTLEGERCVYVINENSEFLNFLLDKLPKV
jgi:hypothetical protein